MFLENTFPGSLPGIFLFHTPFLSFLAVVQKSMSLVSPLLALERLAKGKVSFRRVLVECLGKTQVSAFRLSPQFELGVL